VRILIADDSKSLGNSLAALLSKLPGVAEIKCVQDGLEALEQVRALKPDVLVLDMRLPNLSGLQILEHLQREQLHPTVIMFTSFAKEDYLPVLSKLGVRFFVTKPDYEELVEILKTL
jgi:CheY-like chemotaxis protein